MKRKSGLGNGYRADVFELRGLEVANARTIALAGTAVVTDIPATVGTPVFCGTDNVHATFPTTVQVDGVATNEAGINAFVFG